MDEIEAMLRPLSGMEAVKEVHFPLTAIVGHQEAKRGIILSLINPGLSLLIYGEKGLGKKTMLLSASAFLSEIESTGCPFNCEPGNKVLMCTDCKKGGWTPKKIEVPFVLLPYSVEKETLTGTVKNPYSSLLGSANRGILAIRDIENYPEEIVNTVFSVLKKHRVELESYTYPAFFQPIATYNGVPGKIRENFVLNARVEEVKDIEERIEILRRVEMFRKNPQSFYMAYEKEEMRLKQRIEEGRAILRKINVPSRISSVIKKSVEKYGLKKEYERRLVVASTANAAYEGRLVVGEDDVREVMKMIIPTGES